MHKNITAESSARRFSKIFVIAIFVVIGLLLRVGDKQRVWLAILGSFAAGLGAISNIILNRTNLT